MTQFRQVPETTRSRDSARPIHAVDLAHLAGVADALVVDGRSDLAAYVVQVLYYCADRQVDRDNIVPFRDNKRDGA